MRYAEVLLDLPYEASYSYIIPESLSDAAVFGVRCIVPFGRRRMTGFIIDALDEKPAGECGECICSNIDKRFCQLWRREGSVHR